MTKANTLPKMPPAIAAIQYRPVADCDVPAAGWADDRQTARVLIRRRFARPVQRTDTPDMPDLWRFEMSLIGRDTCTFFRIFETEQEAMSCLEVLRLRPVTPRICLDLGFEV